MLDPVKSSAIRMAALTILQARALTAGAEFTAVRVLSLRHALALFNFALAVRVRALFCHDGFLLGDITWIGSYRATQMASRKP